MHPLTKPSCPCATSLSSLLLNTIYHSHLYISIICSLINYRRKLVKCIPKLMCSKVSVLKKSFFFNYSLLYCIISLSKTALPSVAFQKFSHDKLLWSNSGIARRKENLVNQRKKSIPWRNIIPRRSPGNKSKQSQVNNP